jgi:hypothetical protein
MAARSLSAVSLATILAFTIPSLASAGELRLVFSSGRVTLMARDVPLQDILAEWERVGGTRVVNRDAVSGPPVTLYLVDVTEAHALATVLRSAAGYLAFARTAPADAVSQFTRIVIMPGGERLAAAPQVAAAPQPSGATAGPGPRPPQVQQRIMPDGRVISVMEYPARPAERAVAEEAETVQPPPVEAPSAMAVPVAPGLAAVPAAPIPSVDSLSGAQEQGKPAELPTQISPTVPATAAKPGAVIPGSRPEPAPYTPQGPPPPPVPPIKPPGL